MERADVLLHLGINREDMAGFRSDQVEWEQIAREVGGEYLPFETRRALAYALFRASTVEGECRINGFADLGEVFPVLEDDGLHWECNHPSPHKSVKVAALSP